MLPALSFILSSSRPCSSENGAPFWSRQGVNSLYPNIVNTLGARKTLSFWTTWKKCYASFSWVDDTLLAGTTTWVLRWSFSRGFSPPSPPCSCANPCQVLKCPTRKWNEDAIKQLDLFLEYQTNLYMSQITQLAIRVSHFSGFYLKCTQSPNPKLQKLLDQEVSLKTPFDSDSRLQSFKAGPSYPGADQS